MRQSRFSEGLFSGGGSIAVAKRTRRGRSRRARSMARLRSAYFASASEAASRYGVTFDRLVGHLWQARSLNRGFTLRSVSHVEDLVHAVACIDDVGLAWAELADRFERALVRKCRNSSAEIDATIAVRRMLADLRRHNGNPQSYRFPTLHGYAGTQPLRVWLGERALGSAAWTGANAATRRFDVADRLSV